MKEGKLIVIEGSCDGIGKTTQYQLLCKRLKQENVHVVNHHFPSYGTYQGMPVEKYLKGDYGTLENLWPYFITSLYAMDRSITWNMELKKLYEEGSYLILDRYTTSSLFYQSTQIKDLSAKKEFINWVEDYEYNKLGIQKPDNVIFLTASFDLVTKMRMTRKDNDGIANDIHERNLDFMKKVYENSLFVADYLSWQEIDCAKGNQLRPIEEIHEDVYRLVKNKRKI